MYAKEYLHFHRNTNTNTILYCVLVTSILVGSWHMKWPYTLFQFSACMNNQKQPCIYWKFRSAHQYLHILSPFFLFQIIPVFQTEDPWHQRDRKWVQRSQLWEEARCQVYESAMHSEDANYAGSLLSDPTEAPLTEYAQMRGWCGDEVEKLREYFLLEILY